MNHKRISSYGIRSKALIPIVISFILPLVFSITLIARGVVTDSSDTEIESHDTASRVVCTIPDDTLPPITSVTCEVIEITEVVETKEVAETTETVEVTEIPARYYDCPLSHDLQDYIRELCDENGIPMSLVIAVIEVESSFESNTISDTDDWGLMQINECNHEWLSETYGITDFLDPYQNVFSGITILSQHYDNYQDEDKALMAYNLGATGAKRYWNNGIYETSYSQKIQSVKEAYDDEI